MVPWMHIWKSDTDWGIKEGFSEELITELRSGRGWVWVNMPKKCGETGSACTKVLWQEGAWYIGHCDQRPQSEVKHGVSKTGKVSRSPVYGHEKCFIWEKPIGVLISLTLAWASGASAIICQLSWGPLWIDSLIKGLYNLNLWLSALSLLSTMDSGLLIQLESARQAFGGSCRAQYKFLSLWLLCFDPKCIYQCQIGI